MSEVAPKKVGMTREEKWNAIFSKPVLVGWIAIFTSLGGMMYSRAVTKNSHHLQMCARVRVVAQGYTLVSMLYMLNEGGAFAKPEKIEVATIEK